MINSFLHSNNEKFTPLYVFYITIAKENSNLIVSRVPFTMRGGLGEYKKIGEKNIV